MNLDKIQQPFTESFPGDHSGNLFQRQTPGILYATVQPETFEAPELIVFNENLSVEIGLGKIENQQDIAFLNAGYFPNKKMPYATAYAGHQFGNWAGQLGDGRAIFAGEIINEKNQKTELQWKGAGATPYSRHADGRAVLRSTVREYMMSEYMHHLGIPTTRALSMSLTGENVVRDILYSGDPKPEKGAVMVRCAESFLRFGHFELVSARKEYDLLKKLADFAIDNYYPHINVEGAEKYLAFFKEISERTAGMVVDWFRVGFVHGVMNTDNMSALGLTIDYGPFSMLDEYDLQFTSNTTDLPGRRYAFGEQGKIAQWNLWQLANALFPLINDGQKLQDILDGFGDYFWQKHDEMLCKKFGFDSLSEDDEAFFSNWQDMMASLKIDYTLFFQRLEEFAEGVDSKMHFKDIFYKELHEEEWKLFADFLDGYLSRIKKNKISKTDSLMLMNTSNPKFLLRNYILFEVIEGLEKGDKSLFLKVLDAIVNPYSEKYPEFSIKRPSKYDGVAGCTSLSCSS